MKAKWKTLLEPFANHLYQMERMIIATTDDELQELLKATRMPSTTNCWCFTYNAAPIVKKMVEEQISIRAYAAQKAKE